MIASLDGILERKDSSCAVINVGGIGFECLMSMNSLLALGNVGSMVRVETLLLFKNDALSLYGFSSPEERTLFESLTSVSGVGAKFALAILSTYPPTELTSILQTSDIVRLTEVSGVGKKTAQRIILELQGSLDSLMDVVGIVQNAAPGSAESEAMLALEVMGFSAPEISEAMASVVAEAPSDKDMAASEMVRLALKQLGKR